MAKVVVLSSHAESLLVFRKDMMVALAEHNQVIACAPNASVDVVEKLAEIGVAYQHISLARTGLNPITDLFSLIQICQTLKNIKPQQVFSYGAKPVIFGSIAAKLAKVPQIYSMITGVGSYFIHNDTKALIIRKIMSTLYKIALHFNTKVLFQNSDDVQDFARWGIFNDLTRTVITNGSGVNLQYFSPLSPVVDKVSFLLVTRFIQAKGLLEYLTAAKILKQRYPQVEFLLVGWFENKDEAIGPEVLQPYLDKQIVQCLGKLDDVRPALARASVFVLPSYREGTPKSVLEAMASARAIITTDVPGCRETVVEGENGFLIAAKSVDALVIAMEKFINNKDLIISMGQRSRQIALDKYDVNKVNKVILSAMGYSYV